MIRGAAVDPARLVLAVTLFFAGQICFDMMGVLVRILSASHSAQELSAWRNIVGILPSLALLLGRGEIGARQGLFFPQWELAVLRGLVIEAAQFCLYSALGLIELATVSALELTSAFWVMILSVVLLGERVGGWRIAALVLGLGGALMIIRPGTEAFTLAMLLPVLAAVGYALAAVTSRLFDPGVATARIYVFSAAASALGAVVLALSTTGFAPVRDAADGAMLVAMGLCGGTASLLHMLAYRMTYASVLAPLGYFSVVTAFAFGWFFFGEAPVDRLMPGVLLIVAAGALILWRERVQRARHLG